MGNIVEFFELATSFDLPPAEALAFFTAKGLKPTFAWQDMLGAEHDAAFTVAKMMDTDLLQTVQAKLTDALRDGSTFADFKKALIPQLQAAGWWGKQDVIDPLTGKVVKAQLGSASRLETVFRTNLQSAYAAGHWQAIEENATDAPFLLYDAVDDHRTRPEHAAMDGTLLPLTDKWWRTHYPPNGWNCRCGVIQMSQADMAEAGLTLHQPPKVGTKAWVNPRTGDTHILPKDLDPGWDHNPGMARVQHLKAVAAEKAAAIADEAQKAALAHAAKLQAAAHQDYLDELAAAQAELDTHALDNTPYLANAIKQVQASKAAAELNPKQILELAKEKAAKTQAAAYLADYKAAAVKGKPPSAKAQAAFDALSADEKVKVTAAIEAKSGEAAAKDAVAKIAAGQGDEYTLAAYQQAEQAGDLAGLKPKAQIALIEAKSKAAAHADVAAVTTEATQLGPDVSKALFVNVAKSVGATESVQEVATAMKLELAQFKAQAQAEALATLKAIGEGTHAPQAKIKQALLDKYSKDGTAGALTVGANPAKLVEKIIADAAAQQAKADDAAYLSGYKKKIIAGKIPSPKEQAAFDALTPDKQDALLLKIDAEKAALAPNLVAQTGGPPLPDGTTAFHIDAITLYRAAETADLPTTTGGKAALGDGTYFGLSAEDVAGYGPTVHAYTVSGNFVEVFGDAEYDILRAAAAKEAAERLAEHLAAVSAGTAKIDAQLVAKLSSPSGNIAEYFLRRNIVGIKYNHVTKGDHHSQVVVFDHVAAKAKIAPPINASIAKAKQAGAPAAPAVPTTPKEKLKATIEAANNGGMYSTEAAYQAALQTAENIDDATANYVSEVLAKQAAEKGIRMPSWATVNAADTLSGEDYAYLKAMHSQLKYANEPYLWDNDAHIEDNKIWFDGLPKADKKSVGDAIKLKLEKMGAPPEQLLAKKPGAQPAAPPATAPHPSAVTPEPLSMKNMTKTGAQKGSNTGGFYQDTTTGIRYYIKEPATVDIARNEVLAAELYRAAGVEVPELTIWTEGGATRIASKIIDGVKENAAALKAGSVPGAGDNFVVDAWLGNWDVAGLSYDNLLMVGGRAVRVDVGGSLRYRAQGGLKGAAWGDTVTELESLRNPSINAQTAAVFKHVTDTDLIAGARKVAAITDAQIDALVAQHGPLDAGEAASLAAKLKARREYIRAKLLKTTADVTQHPKYAKLAKKLTLDVETAKTHLDESLLTAIKGIASRAASSAPLEAKDLQRVADAEKLFGELVAKAGTAATQQTTTQLRAHYQPFIDALRKAVAPGQGAPAAWSGGKFATAATKIELRAGIITSDMLDAMPAYDEAAAEQFLKSHGTPTASKMAAMRKAGLDEVQAKAVTAYTGGAFSPMNSYLRGQGATAGVADATEAAILGLQKLPQYPAGSKLNRGVSAHGISDRAAFIAAHTAPGNIVRWNAFTSTSYGGGFGGDVKFTITTARTHADVTSISHYQSEKEVLLYPGSIFRVTSATQSGGTWHIAVEEILSTQGAAPLEFAE